MKHTKLILIGTAAVLLAVGALLFLLLAPTYLGNYLICIVGGIMCLLATVNTIDTYRCKIQVSAILISYNFEQFKAHTTSSPILTYCFQGKTYTTACAEIFSQRYVLKHYEQGKAYTAYLCEKDPSFIKLKRSIRPFDLGLFLLGLAIMTLSIVTIFTA